MFRRQFEGREKEGSGKTGMGQVWENGKIIEVHGHM